MSFLRKLGKEKNNMQCSPVVLFLVQWYVTFAQVGVIGCACVVRVLLLKVWLSGI